MIESPKISPCFLITGAAKRIGACLARQFHAYGCRLVLHYHKSQQEAETLAAELNAIRPHSVHLFAANLEAIDELPAMVQSCIDHFGRLDGVIHNASSFYATPLGSIKASDWDQLIGPNLKAPLFLTQAAAPYLQASGGTVISILDIHAKQPLPDYLVYSLAKAGHAQLVKALSYELAPHVRVNGIAPGPNIWPDDASVFQSEVQSQIVRDIPLGRVGQPEDIAKAALFLAFDAPFVTGEILAVSGGRGICLP